jgi:hypothetical protein
LWFSLPRKKERTISISIPYWRVLHRRKGKHGLGAFGSIIITAFGADSYPAALRSGKWRQVATISLYMKHETIVLFRKATALKALAERIQ